MSVEDTIGFLNDGESCLVCGKSLKAGEALVAMRQGESRLPICCPLCLEAYQKDPNPYLERLAKQTLLRELRRASNGESSNRSK